MSRQNNSIATNQAAQEPRRFNLCAFLCCSKQSVRTVTDPQRRPPEAEQTNTNRANRVRQQPRRESRSRRQDGRPRDSESPSSFEEEQKAPLPKETNLQLTTNFTEKDVKYVDEQPDDREGRHKFKFYCPICLRYFTHMLQSACCQNYICLYCCRDLQVKEEKEPMYRAECPYKCSTTESGTLF